MAGALLTGLTTAVVPQASADQIGNLQAQAKSIENKINELGLQENTLSEQYDGAVLAAQTAQQKVNAAAKTLAAADAATNKAKQALKQEAIQAYVQGGSSGLTSNSGSMTDANTGLLRAEYVSSLATDQSDAVDSYHLATLQDQAAKDNLEQAQHAAQQQVAQLNKDKQSVQASANELTAEESQVKGQIATLIKQQQAAELAAEQAAARAKAQQEAAAAAAAAAAAQRAAAAKQAEAQTVSVPTAHSGGTSTVAASRSTAAATASASSGGGGGGGASVSASVPALSGSVVQRAIAAALSRVGDPYVWGAAGPSSFDCSGLVMWAYAQAGVSLPHFSGAQYADMTHVSMSSLEPGDVVFFSDPNEHEAMYIGGGQIVEAPHTGADVHVTALYGEFTLAGRVG